MTNSVLPGPQQRLLLPMPGRRELAVALANLSQPMTATQLARRTHADADHCGQMLRRLRDFRAVRCLNPAARTGRVYWITERGRRWQAKLLDAAPRTLASVKAPEVDWDLYGWVCYRHRSAVLKAMTEAMRPATIRRKAKGQDPHLRMSANNTRDVIRLFLQRGVVRPVRSVDRHHLCYELTETGRTFQALLWRAGVPA